MMEVPRIGLGTYGFSDDSTCTNSVVRALEVGYRHIDTAQGYRNERAVGMGIEQAAVSRSDITVASKVYHDSLEPTAILSSTKRSLEQLGTDVLDIQYVHWPIDTYDPERTLPAFDRLVEDGLVDHIGVANFTVELLEEATHILSEPISVVQVELHPLLKQRRLREYAVRNDIHVIAYSPLAKGLVTDVPVINDTARERNLSPVQVTLAWHSSLENVTPIPKATGSHIRENYEALDVELSSEDIERIDSITEERRLRDRPEAPWNQ